MNKLACITLLICVMFVGTTFACDPATDARIAVAIARARQTQSVAQANCDCQCGSPNCTCAGNRATNVSLNTARPTVTWFGTDCVNCRRDLSGYNHTVVNSLPGFPPYGAVINYTGADGGQYFYDSDVIVGQPTTEEIQGRITRRQARRSFQSSGIFRNRGGSGGCASCGG